MFLDPVSTRHQCAAGARGQISRAARWVPDARRRPADRTARPEPRMPANTERNASHAPVFFIEQLASQRTAELRAQARPHRAVAKASKPAPSIRQRAGWALVQLGLRLAVGQDHA